MATEVESDQKAPFLIATTLRCRGGHYSFPWIAPLYPWYVPYIAEEVSSTIFRGFGMTRPGIEPKSQITILNTPTASLHSGKIHPRSILDMILNNLIVWLQILQEFWGMRSTFSLPSLPGPQLDLNCLFMLNWIAWNRTLTVL